MYRIIVRYLRRKPRLPRIQFLANRAAARALVVSRLEFFNQFYGFVYTRVSIRNQRTRWGSCSRSGTLSFNVRLVMIDPTLADFVIVHELCHIAEMNHSRNFWALVERTIPDYKKRRSELRRIHL